PWAQWKPSPVQASTAPRAGARRQLITWASRHGHPPWVHWMLELAMASARGDEIPAFGLE
ncbi:MAG TPA: hypothetical protein P5282_11235, partial [Anaerolineaceae bacterium]|nr:hypothetical protein [Anaerolineaceae bacterium]